MPLERCNVNGLQGLLEKVIEINAHLGQDRFLWYRGLSCADYGLVPKIMRDGKTPEEIFEREKRLLTRFRQRSMAYWPAGYPQDDWEHLFAMQHFGMPTRLLDWSENLFVATYFALADVPAAPHASTPTVWCVDPIAWNRSTPLLAEFGDLIQVLTTADDDLDAYRPDTTKRRPKSPLAMFGAHNSARIVAQRGTFMVWGNDTHPLETFAEEQDATLWKLELGGNQAELATSLRLLGFGETMVFPELPSLGRELTKSEGWKP